VGRRAGWEGFLRAQAGAAAAGHRPWLRHRPRAELVADTLAWETRSGPGPRPEAPVLSAAAERDLIQALG